MYGSKILTVNCGLEFVKWKYLSVYCCWLMCSCLLVVAGH